MKDVQGTLQRTFDQLMSAAADRDTMLTELALAAFEFSCMHILNVASRLLDEGALFKQLEPLIRDMLVVARERPQTLVPSAKRCTAMWCRGILSPPGPDRPSGWCQLDAGHEGDHLFPNNNRQPEPERMPCREAFPHGNGVNPFGNWCHECKEYRFEACERLRKS